MTSSLGYNPSSLVYNPSYPSANPVDKYLKNQDKANVSAHQQPFVHVDLLKHQGPGNGPFHDGLAGPLHQGGKKRRKRGKRRKSVKRKSNSGKRKHKIGRKTKRRK